MLEKDNSQSQKGLKKYLLRGLVSVLALTAAGSGFLFFKNRGEQKATAEVSNDYLPEVPNSGDLNLAEENIDSPPEEPILNAETDSVDNTPTNPSTPISNEVQSGAITPAPVASTTKKNDNTKSSDSKKDSKKSSSSKKKKSSGSSGGSSSSSKSS